MEIRFTQLKAEAATFTLEIDNWVIEQHSWGVFSTEGDIGSLLANLLCGELIASSGSLQGNKGKIAQVSLSEQQRLLELELANDDSEFICFAVKPLPFR